MAKMAGSTVYDIGIVYSAQYQYQYQYTVYMVQYTAAYWTRTHTLYALLPYSP